MTKKNNILDLSKKLQAKRQTEFREVIEMCANMMLKALKFKDEYTYGHSLRVAFYSVLLGKEIGLDDKELYDLELSALFHDIGKIGVVEHVLNKPSRLDEDEFLIMKAHPEISGEILNELEFFSDIAEYARLHHERYDGRGYPEGLSGEDIPLFSRVILIADTFDAMTSTRSYREGLPYEVAYEELIEFAGSQFDPNLVQSFIDCIERERAAQSDSFSLSILNKTFKKSA